MALLAVVVAVVGCRRYADLSVLILFVVVFSCSSYFRSFVFLFLWLCCRCFCECGCCCRGSRHLPPSWLTLTLLCAAADPAATATSSAAAAAAATSAAAAAVWPPLRSLRACLRSGVAFGAAMFLTGGAAVRALRHARPSPRCFSAVVLGVSLHPFGAVRESAPRECAIARRARGVA